MPPDAEAGEDASLPGRVLARVVAAMGGTERPGQVRMVAEVTRALQGGEHVMVQAGTGTGKSLGYLVPVLCDCVTRDHRALVSTATLALQRQIIVKDAPAVVDAIEAETGVRPEVALLKGWSNYVCLHRVGGGHPAGGLFDAAGAGPVTDLGQEVLRVREWSGATTTGDRDDLVPGVSDRAWRQVSVSRRECLGRACPMVEECFAQAARERAARADLVVTNHSLLGIHAMGAPDLFPDVDAVVVDEAHELPERVRDQASHELSRTQVARVARAARTHARVDTTALDGAGAALGAVLASADEGLLLRRGEALVAAVGTLDAAVRDALTQVQGSPVDQASKLLAKGALDELSEALEDWSRPEASSITWVTRSEGDQAERLVVAPLDVAPAIGTVGLGDRPAVLTSATLALGGSFDALARACGLMVSDVPWRGLDVGTAFDTRSQGILYVARNLPDPGREGPSPEALAELVDLARASRGGVLALFSSWRGADAGVEALRAGTDLRVLAQGEETVSTLVDRFREDRDSCLVGTMSLWQGVDVVGDACRLVVIDRIPFPHPGDPVSRARAIDAERHGLNGFRTVGLAHAALLMAQGAGRLLRTREDRGVVAVLDRRLLTKSYGSFILRSLPPMWPTTDGALVRSSLANLAAGLPAG